MGRGALDCGNERIGRLLDAVVEERVAAVQAEDQPCTHRLPECRVDLRLSWPVNHAQGGGLCADPQTGELFQGILGGGGQAVQLADHEIHHVVAVALGPDARHVPSPSGRARVEREQPLLSQRGDELDREEWIAAGLLVHELR